MYVTSTFSSSGAKFSRCRDGYNSSEVRGVAVTCSTSEFDPFSSLLGLECTEIQFWGLGSATFQMYFRDILGFR